MVKYSPLPKGTPKGEGLYLTVYPELSPNTDSILFLYKFGNNFSIVLQGRVILEELIICKPLPGRDIFHHTLPSCYISQYTP